MLALEEVTVEEVDSTYHKEDKTKAHRGAQGPLGKQKRCHKLLRELINLRRTRVTSLKIKKAMDQIEDL